MKVVLDTNIIVSALFWGGLPGIILKEIQQKHTLCFTRATFSELRRVLSCPKFSPYIQKLNFTLEEFLEKLTKNALVVSTSLYLVSIIKEHPADNIFLACALASQANFIISGDSHLLKLKSFQRIPILTPKKFLQKYRKQK